MDTKLLLIRIITILFMESLIFKKGNASSRTLATEALKHVKLQEASVIADFSKDPISKLRDIIIWMLDQSQEHVFDRADLLQRLRLATEGEDYTYDAVRGPIETESTNEEIMRVIKTNREEINVFINKAIVTGIVKNAWTQAAFKPEQVDWNAYAKNLINELEPFKSIGEADRSTCLESIDLTNPASLEAAFKDGLKTINPEGIIRFGWQGFNKMFGQQGGGRRGEMVVVGALQHNFKSGTTLELLKHAALYNKPFMMNEGKKPLLLRYSFENPAIVDIMHIFKSLMEAETNQLIDETMIDPIAAAIYVNEKLSATGYKVVIEHHDPTNVTVAKLFDMIESWENKGYEIHMLNLDYLAMISTKGCKQGATGQDIRDLFRRVRNFIESKQIFCVTPHQLSVDAKKRTRDGGIEADFVREIANKGYWDSCSTIDQEVDMEIYQHLVKINGETYITWMRGKHRKAGTPTPFEDYYCVYKFGKVAFIPDDIMGISQSRKKVAANPLAEGGQVGWFDSSDMLVAA